MLHLSVQTRSKTGRRNNKQFRKQGLIPAVLYGHKVKSAPLLVSAKGFEKIYQQAGESTLIKLKIESENKERVVLIYDLVNDPVSDKISHVDFYQVKMDEPITVEVPLIFAGESPAVKNENGILIKNIQEIKIEALPADLIHQIEVDISSLKTLDSNIRVNDLNLPEKVKFLANPEEVVVLVSRPRTTEELEELKETPVEEVEEVAVEEKGKAKIEVEENETAKPSESSEKES